ncbi:MAG: hypothetical protein L0Z53_05685 [Acidobacteriales bacterium]|nr:hypothetical protein [Terriglobales bacterium]
MCLTAALSAAAAPGPLSSAGLQGWVEQTFKDLPPVHYRFTREGGVQVLEAECRASASGWLWRETVDLRACEKTHLSRFTSGWTKHHF